jgi:hypothetical protein
MTERTLVGQILDNIPSNPMASIEPNVTGRDVQMAREALVLAVPIALRYSLASSNTLDMMRTLKSLGGGMPIPDFRGSEDHVVKTVIAELRDGKKTKANENPKFPDRPHPLQDLIDEYLSDPEMYMPEKGRW